MEEKTKKKIIIIKKKIKGRGNLPGPARMGAVGMAETSTVGTAEASAEGTTRMGVTGMVEAGIPTPAATPGPSKVSASKEIGIQIRRKNKESKLNRKEEKTHTHKIRLR